MPGGIPERMVSIERAEADLMRARGEVVRLTAQLRAAESRVVKIENYLEMARAYDGVTNDTPKPRNGGGSPLVVASLEIIRERGTRQPTRLLVEELEQRGHHIGGTNKVTNLSGALSRSPSLSASRIEGWGLKEWEATESAEENSQASEEEDGLGPFIAPDAPPEADEGEDDDSIEPF